MIQGVPAGLGGTGVRPFSGKTGACNDEYQRNQRFWIRKRICSSLYEAGITILLSWKEVKYTRRRIAREVYRGRDERRRYLFPGSFQAGRHYYETSGNGDTWWERSYSGSTRTPWSLCYSPRAVPVVEAFMAAIVVLDMLLEGPDRLGAVDLFLKKKSFRDCLTWKKFFLVCLKKKLKYEFITGQIKHGGGAFSGINLVVRCRFYDVK